jgi:beta-glucanase (GH16 family)
MTWNILFGLSHLGRKTDQVENEMTHDVFISYSSKDKPIADAICANLEAAGIRCWIAPRDIAPGEDWPTAIARAISHSRIMVLVFSASSNSSDDVGRELILAANSKLIIIPFKIENIEPEPGKQYYLARTHWLDAINPPTQEQINTLLSCVKALIPNKASALVPRVEPGITEQIDQTFPGKKPPQSPLPGLPIRKSPAWSRYLWIPAAFVLLVLIGWGILTFFRQSFPALMPSQVRTTETTTAAIPMSTTLMPKATITPFVPDPTITPMGSFLDNMDSYNSYLFKIASGWATDYPYNASWRSDHINFTNGIMTLTLDNLNCPDGCLGRPYASGLYSTNFHYGYGLYEVRLKSTKASGIVGGFFINTGPWENQPYDQITINFLGNDPYKMQASYFANGIAGPESLIDLGFDSSVDFHTYGFEYRATYINWYVDGKLVHTEDGSHGALPSHKMKLTLNLWPGIGEDDQLGAFSYTGPLNFQVDWAKYMP